MLYTYIICYKMDYSNLTNAKGFSEKNRIIQFSDKLTS